MSARYWGRFREKGSFFSEKAVESFIVFLLPFLLFIPLLRPPLRSFLFMAAQAQREEEFEEGEDTSAAMAIIQLEVRQSSSSASLLCLCALFSFCTFGALTHLVLLFGGIVHIYPSFEHQTGPSSLSFFVSHL